MSTRNAGRWKRPKLLQRKRIEERLAGIFEVPLFFLVAPMGYGKTTAVKEFIKNKKDLRHVWFTLGSNEDDELWIWQRFCQSLADINQSLSSQLASYRLPQTTPDRERVIGIVRNAMSSPTVIIVDDYHSYESKQMNLLLTTLAEVTIPDLHIVLISRTIPEIPLDELALKGRCAVLSQRVLEFTREETVDLFAINGFCLSDEEQAALIAFTDGWVAAIYLTLMRYAEDGTLGENEDIMQLMRTAIYDKLDKNTQQILLKLSLIDSFSLDEAIYVTENKSAGALLRKLTANNCFVRYNHRTQIYAIHAILRKVLSAHLGISDIDQAALFARCGDWCAKHSEYIGAVHFYHKAGCYERILDIYELPGAVDLIDKAPQIVTGAFGDMDITLKLARPLAYITYIYSYLISVDPAVGAKLLYEAKAVYEASTNLVDKERILGEIALTESFLQFPDASAMNAYQKKAHALFAGASSQIANPQDIFAFGSPHTLYLFHCKPGALLSLVELIEADFHYYQHIANGCGTGFEHTVRAEYSLETADLAAAELAAHKAIFKARTREQLSLVICGHLCLARLSIIDHQPHAVPALIDGLRAEVEATGHPVLISSMEVAAGYVHAILGDLEGIPKWLRDGDVSHCNMYVQGMGISHIVIGGAAILRRSYAELKVIAETMRETYGPQNFLFGPIFANIYDAIADKHLNDMAGAKRNLLAGIELARADGILMPFVENMSELLPLLQEITGTEHAQWIARVLDLGRRFIEGVHIFNRERENRPLTAREQDILWHLGKGLSQKEIAEGLSLSLNTVRRHLQNIYDKLGVHNKTLAIQQAKARNIIP